MDESTIVTAVGVAVSGVHDAHAQRLNDAMVAEVLKCNAEGISTEEKNSEIIRARMLAAHQRELDAIAADEAAHDDGPPVIIE